MLLHIPFCMQNSNNFQCVIMFNKIDHMLTNEIFQIAVTHINRPPPFLPRG